MGLYRYTSETNDFFTKNSLYSTRSDEFSFKEDDKGSSHGFDIKFLEDGFERVNLSETLKEQFVESIKDRIPDTVKMYEKPVKHNTDKPMMSLIRPEFSLAIAEALTYGYTKYDEKRGDIQNYLKSDGFHYSTIYDSLQRHLNAFWSGENDDLESGLSHLALAASNLMFLHAYITGEKGQDDRVLVKKDGK